MITAMIYPTVVLVLSIAVITFIIMFVIPRFVEFMKIWMQLKYQNLH